MNTRLQVLQFDNASLLALKVFAFAAMVLDHLDWFLWTGQGAHAGIGRLVFPIFGVVLAFNASRTDIGKLLHKVIPRLVLIGALAQVPYAVLLGAVVPLNIMFTLALSLAVYCLAERRAWLPAVLLLVVPATFVDYAWYGVAGVALTAWLIRHGDQAHAWLGAVLFCLLLTFVNGNQVALLALPLLWCASRLRIGDAPRWRYLFLVGYPLHLVVLAIVKLA